jgi:hypothetical protein
VPGARHPPPPLPCAPEHVINIDSPCRALGVLEVLPLCSSVCTMLHFRSCRTQRTQSWRRRRLVRWTADWQPWSDG